MLAVTALGSSIAAARDRAYEAVAKIHFEGCQYRRDIALAAVAAKVAPIDAELPFRLSLTIACCSALLANAQNGPRPSPSPTIAQTPAPTATGGLDTGDLQQALTIIQRRYLDPKEVTGTELNRATLDGLLTRLGGGVVLLSSPTPTPAPDPFYREILDGHIGYLRPGDLSHSQIQELDATLRGFAGKSVDAIILDLRDTPESSDYPMAAEFASRFVGKGKALFSLVGPAINSGTRIFFETRSALLGVDHCPGRSPDRRRV